MREIDADITWDYWRKLDVWTLEQACKLVYPKDPYSYKTKSSTPAARIRGHPDILNRDPRSRPAWANLWHLAFAAVRAGTLPYVPVGRQFFVLRPHDFLAWAQENGVTIPPELAGIASPRPADETEPSTTIAADKRRAPDIFVAAVFRLIAEIRKRAGEKGMPFDMHAMPGTKADFRALAIKFDSRFNKAPSTFDDYLTGLLRFKQGARETNFYRDLFPELFT